MAYAIKDWEEKSESPEDQGLSHFKPLYSSVVYTVLEQRGI